VIERYFSAYIQRLGISSSEFLGLGRQNPANRQRDFCMTVLALRLASFSNGVSSCTGKFAAYVEQPLARVLESEVPIRHVTNGVTFGVGSRSR